MYLKIFLEPGILSIKFRIVVIPGGRQVMGQERIPLVGPMI